MAQLLRLGIGSALVALCVIGSAACVDEPSVVRMRDAGGDAGVADATAADARAGGGDACSGDCGELGRDAGERACGAGRLACADECVDPTSDRAHCGSCGHACDGDCRQGRCACAAQPLAAQLPVAIELDTRTGADLLSGSCGGGGANEAVFAFKAPHAGTFLFSTAGSRFNTVLYLRADGCDGRELACADDRAADLASRIEIELARDQSVAVVVDGFEGQVGRAQLHIEALTASSCCTAGAEPGCAVAEVEACVCALDELCCALAWDELCVAAVASAGCGQCAASAAECSLADSGAAAALSLSGTLTAGEDRVETSCGAAGEADLLFGFVAPRTATYVFDSRGSEPSDTVLAVLDGAECGGEELACSDDIADELQARASVALRAGQEVRVVVESWDGERGAVAVAVSDQAAAAPVRCEPSRMSDALPLTVTAAVDAGPSALEPSCAPFDSAGETLFSFAAPETGRYRFDTQGSSADTLLQLIEGDDCSGRELACNDDPEDGSSLAAALEADLSAGQVVVINVDSLLGEGDFVLTIARAP